MHPLAHHKIRRNSDASWQAKRMSERMRGGQATPRGISIMRHVCSAGNGSQARVRKAASSRRHRFDPLTNKNKPGLTVGAVANGGRHEAHPAHFPDVTLHVAHHLRHTYTAASTRAPHAKRNQDEEHK